MTTTIRPAVLCLSNDFVPQGTGKLSPNQSEVVEKWNSTTGCDARSRPSYSISLTEPLQEDSVEDPLRHQIYRSQGWIHKILPVASSSPRASSVCSMTRASVSDESSEAAVSAAPSTPPKIVCRCDFFDSCLRWKRSREKKRSRT